MQPTPLTLGNQAGVMSGDLWSDHDRGAVRVKLQQYPEGVGSYADFIQANWVGSRTADCVGLIKGYGWLDAETLELRYGHERYARRRCKPDVL